MNYPFKITINDHDSAWKIKHNIQIGHYFVFIKKQIEPKSFEKSVFPLTVELQLTEY